MNIDEDEPAVGKQTEFAAGQEDWGRSLSAHFHALSNSSQPSFVPCMRNWLSIYDETLQYLAMCQILIFGSSSSFRRGPPVHDEKWKERCKNDETNGCHILQSELGIFAAKKKREPFKRPYPGIRESYQKSRTHVRFITPPSHHSLPPLS